MRRTIQTSMACLAILVVIGSQANAGLIDSANYSLTTIEGSYAWGQTNWNDAAVSGYVDNIADLATVDNMMAGPYVPSPGEIGPINGIYNWPVGQPNALTYAFNGGVDYMLESLSFITSRNWSPTTTIAVEYALDDGPWLPAMVTTTGALGIPLASQGHVSTVAFAPVQADAFRFVSIGDATSLHKISVEGSLVIVEPPEEPDAVPEPASLALCGIGMLGLVLGVARRRRK